MSASPLPDPIDAAIKAVEEPPKQLTVEMAQLTIQLPPLGRPLILALPRDITQEEALNALIAIPAALQQLRATNPVTRLVGPNGQGIG